MNVWVTGARGALGQAVAARLRAAGRTVTSCGRRPGAGIDVAWDLARGPEPAPVPAPDVLVHGAARIGGLGLAGDDAAALCDDNVGGTWRLAHWCVRQRVRRLIVISSASVYGGFHADRQPETAPVDPWAAGSYATSKWLAEEAARLVTASGLELTVLRLASLIGADADRGLVPALLRQARETGRIALSPPFDDRFDLLHVADAARTVCHAVAAPAWGLWNVGGGEPIGIDALAEACAAATDTAVVYGDDPADRPPRTLNWVDDRLARRDLDHDNQVPLVAAMRETASHLSP